MPTNDSAQIATQDAVRALARELDAAPHGERSERVRGFAALYGWSVDKVYRELRKVGWSSGRRPRADRGATSQCMEALTHLSAAQRLGVRKNGKITMRTPNARSLLAVNGRPFTVSNARINTLLRQRQMDVATQKRDRAAQPQRSLHPNHVHQVDPSLCLIYYLRDGTQQMMAEDEFYKNKPENLDKVDDLKVWRYVLVDHYSGTIIVRYYQAKGETTANLFDFLLYCWGQLGDRPFHGVPQVLLWDKGSANTSAPIRVACQALQVQTIAHRKGNPRAKGAVEKANDIVETLFESRLRYEPVANVDELNAAAEAWYNAYNADAIPEYDSRINRRFMERPLARYALWQTIRQEQLRLLPDVALCRYLLSADPVERKASSDLLVSFRHPQSKRREWYDVSHLPGVYPNATVRVSPLVYGEREVLVHVEDYRGEETTHAVGPVAVDGFAGFRADGAVIGQEMKSQPDTSVESAGKAADRAAFPGRTDAEIDKAKDKQTAPFDGTIDAHSHLLHVDRPAYMARPGSEMSVPDRVQVEAKPLSHIEACRRLVAALGRRLDRDENALVRRLYPNGVPEAELDTLIARLRDGQDPDAGIALVK